MIVLVGESASGKSSIEKFLVEEYGYNHVVSYTTRQPRSGEVNGVDYHFITEEEFEKRLNEGFFAESTCYNGWHYGCAVEDCTDDKVIVANPHGLRQLRKNDKVNVIAFYIDVPRRDRLIKILQRGDNIEEAYRRSLSDEGQFTGIADECDYVIENPGYEKTIGQMALEVNCSMCGFKSDCKCAVPKS